MQAEPASEVPALQPGPAPYHLADWRRCVQDLYADLRRMSPQEAHAHWQATRTHLFRHHPLSPLPEAARATFPGPEIFPYDPALRFAAHLTETEGAPLAFDLGTDGHMQARPLAIADIGHPLTLYWITGYGGGLFLPFRDATSGRESYGGGRYLIDAIKGADLGLDTTGRLILDFNFAYTPSCAWNPAYTCPLSPPENTLPIPIRAGEKTPGGQNAQL